jgi:hypothetical protein
MRICAHDDCGHANLPHATFCTRCGRAVERRTDPGELQIAHVLDRCGHANPPHAKVCGGCGQPLGGLVQPAKPPCEPEKRASEAPDDGYSFFGHLLQSVVFLGLFIIIVYVLGECSMRM